MPKKSKNSTTGVNPLHSHGFGVWGNRRIVVGVRIDEKLYKAFKPAAKRFFGSVCRPVESFMATVVVCTKERVNFGETVKIGKLVIERNLRSRRKLEVVDEKPNEPVKVVPSCGFCSKPAVSSFKHIESGKAQRTCEFHTRQLRERRDWVEVV